MNLKWVTPDTQSEGAVHATSIFTALQENSVSRTA